MLVKSRTALLGAGVTTLAMVLSTQAFAQQRRFDIPAQDAATAVTAFALQADLQISAPTGQLHGVKASAVSGEMDARAALQILLQGTGLVVARDDGRTIVLQMPPQSEGVGGSGAEVEALIVTAQKREEDIQDVPIAISAFSQEALERSQIAGGPDLMTQVPNMTFTKTNFSSYSIQIRGIGTQAISATTDAAVAVAFNNSSLIRNRFFEQEFYDLQRVEVLRGPQGTLYGRNATAGVVNIISAKPNFGYAERLSADIANYHSIRLEGMLNMPLVEDKVALRLAGAWTKRDGYVTNEITGNPIDGRDLWSTRVSLRFEPTDGISADLIWEHFEEDDDRLRSGKQLCKTNTATHVGDMSIVGVPMPNHANLGGPLSDPQVMLSQGCEAASLYSPDSFQTPNGKSLPYYLPLGSIFLPISLTTTGPYLNQTQSTDLRVIESTVDPEYRAETDVAELQLSFDLGNDLTLASETVYSTDDLFSLQDFNRFNTAPGAWSQEAFDQFIARPGVMTDGVLCDPQIGCADRLVAVDLSTAQSRQFSQELRLSSDYDGRFNFSIGANFLRYDTEDKYYVFINSLSLHSNKGPGPYVPGVTDNRECLTHGMAAGNPYTAYAVVGCIFMDTNPIESLNDLGHNYFLSKNPYKLISYAGFGEAYFNITDDLKLTGGFRWTVDKKEAPRIPSWLLAIDTVGYPVAEVIRLDWSKPTGRLAIDWKPALAFTDETLVYASYAHGYKAGGANPPGYVRVYYSEFEAAEISANESELRRKTFEPEYVDAFELGTKNTLGDGRVTLNLAAFYYDYTGYQISSIIDRSAFNQNFDADVWGLEIEADWRALENLRLGFKGGYENTRVADGMKAIDLMDRTAGNTDWVLARPFPTQASNCILPAFLFQTPTGPILPSLLVGGGPGPCELAYLLKRDPITLLPYVPDPTISGGGADFLFQKPGYEGWDPETAPNNGEGFDKDLSGNELPNAPHFTATITADYTLPLAGDWLMTLHTDLYYQSEAWTRIFNTEGYDKLKAYTNVNLAAIFNNEDAGWKVMAYVKNVFDRDSITGAFLNSDDTGLTTNVFLTEPRLYGLRVTKEWTAAPWWLGGASNHKPGEPYPLTVELAGQVQRQDAPYQTIAPSFTNGFSEALDPLRTQHRDLDWGDGREVGVTYRPVGSAWMVSLGARQGGTNNDIVRLHLEEAAGDKKCAWAPGSFGAQLQCGPDAPKYEKFNYRAAINWSDASTVSRENHDFVDFAVARDIGLGVLGEGRSSWELGLRYAKFESATDATMGGIPDWYLADYWAVVPATMHQYGASLAAAREFKGVGPTLSWNASTRLFGDEDAGHVDIDWSLTGGVLFGKQETAIVGFEAESAFSGKYTSARPLLTPGPVDIRRSESTSAPLIDLSLGLSYEIQRVKIGAGYRWERYFDVLDVGYDEPQAADRTIDGPYFKLAVGFGG